MVVNVDRDGTECRVRAAQDGEDVQVLKLLFLARYADGVTYVPV